MGATSRRGERSALSDHATTTAVEAWLARIVVRPGFQNGLARPGQRSGLELPGTAHDLRVLPRDDSEEVQEVESVVAFVALLPIMIDLDIMPLARALPFVAFVPLLGNDTPATGVRCPGECEAAAFNGSAPR